jgi:hypothetical protein
MQILENSPFLLILLWFEAPFAMEGQETCTSTYNTKSLFMLLLLLLQNALQIYISTLIKTLCFPDECKAIIFQHHRFYFSNTPQTIDTWYTHAQHNKHTNLPARVIAVGEENPAISRPRDKGQW